MAALDVSQANAAQKAEILKLAAEVRKFEIERFWARSLFFWGFIAAAFVAYAQLYGKQDNDALSTIACFGLVCSIAWTLANRGGKYWQEAWEGKVEAVEVAVIGAKLFSNHEPLKRKGPWGAQLFSVSKLTIALSDFTVLVWVALTVKAAPSISLDIKDRWFPIVLAVTSAYVALLFTLGRSSPREFES